MEKLEQKQLVALILTMNTSGDDQFMDPEAIDQ